MPLVSVREQIFPGILLPHRISDAIGSSRKLVVMAGSALTMPVGDRPGVPPVNHMVELIRQRLSSKPELALAFAAALADGAPEERYRRAFTFLLGCEGQDAVNALVRRAVLQARQSGARAPDRAVLTGADEACRSLMEDDIDGWALSPGVEALGRLAACPRVLDTILTTNFDPLIEVAIARAQGRAHRTVLHSDGSLAGRTGQGTHVIYLHGYWYGSDTLHTDLQIGAARDKLGSSLRSLLRDRLFLVVGYGGWDDVFMNALAEVLADDQAQPDVLWAFHESDPAVIERKYQFIMPHIGRRRFAAYRGVDLHALLPDMARRFIPMTAEETASAAEERRDSARSPSRDRSARSEGSAGAEFVTNASDDEAFARAMFGPFSYEKRYCDSTSKGHYFPREIDRRLDDGLRRGDWMLVEGHPLAGKTRVFFETIRRLMRTGCTVAVWPFKAPEHAGEPLRLPDFPDADCRVVWMDDIDIRLLDLAKRGYSASEISRLLERIAEAGLTLAATARTGPAFYNFRYRFGLDDHIWDKLNSLAITRLEDDEERRFAAWYEACFGVGLPAKFDHHPGSLFLDLETMGTRWRNMGKIAEDHGIKIIAERARDIMRALHVFYVMDAQRPGGLFLQEDVRFYLQKRAQARWTTTAMGAAIERSGLSGRPFRPEEWEELIEFLSQDRFHMGFLRREGEHLRTETAYLEYLVAPDSEMNLARSVSEQFSEEERNRLGLTVTEYNFGEVFRNQRIDGVKDLDRIAKRLKPLGLARMIKVWNQLVALCPSFALARHARELLREAGLAPDVATYVSLIQKAPDFASARALLDEARAVGINLSVAMYGQLIVKAPNFAAAHSMLTAMKDAGLAPDIIAYGALLAKAPDFVAARQVLDAVKAARLAPDLILYSSLLEKAPDYSSAHAVFLEMEDAGIAPDVVMYSSLLAKAPNYLAACDIFAAMKKAGITPDAVTYSSLLAKAPGLAAARTLVDEMQAAGIAQNVFSFSSLVAKAPDLPTARAIVAEMRAARVRPNDFTYNALIDKASSLAAARDVMDEMRAARIKPDVVTYNSLIKKTTDLESAREILAEMRGAQIKPSRITYNTLIGKATDFSQIQAIVAELASERVKSAIQVYELALFKAPDLATARSFVADMKLAGVAPNLAIYNALLTKAPDLPSAREIVAEMGDAGVEPNAGTFNVLVGLAPDLTATRELLATMLDLGLAPNAQYFNVLLAKAPDLAAARELRMEMKAAGVAPSPIAGVALISKVPDFPSARALADELMADGLIVSDFVLSSLFARDLSQTSARDLLDWYRGLPFRADRALESAIRGYTRLRRFDDALAIALQYPFFPASRKLFRKSPEVSQAYFQGIIDLEPAHQNANYAMGLALVEAARGAEAVRFLESARTSKTSGAQPGPWDEHIEQLLAQIDADACAPPTDG